MKTLQPMKQERRERGQSLVEVALFFPIFIIILAGLVEVSQMVITQNRVSQAARVASRFGANGGENDGMVFVALNSITQTLGVDADEWDMWVVRGEVNDGGTAFTDESWEFTHAYGISNTRRYNDVDEDAIRAEILGQLQGDNNGDAAGLRIVGLYATHDVESILGLDSFPALNNIYGVRGLNFMRQTGDTLEASRGCDAFPIAVHEGIRSVNPPGAAVDPYPDEGDFDNDNPPDYDSFIYHTPDVPLSQAREGYVYRIWNGFGEGNFGWLNWNDGINASANTLTNSLAWPGNSKDYTDHNDGGQALGEFDHVVRGYVNPDDTSDLSLNIGDWVPANTGVVNKKQVRDTLSGHIDGERSLRLIIWNNARDQGVNGDYQITRFGVFRLHGYHLAANGSWILAEFVRWDDSCGQMN